MHAIEEITTDDFHRWMVIFEKTASDVFEPTAAPIVVEVARRIANSLWLAKLGKAGDNPPF